MNPADLKNILEAALLVSHEPLSLDKLLGLFVRELEPPERDAIRAALDELAAEAVGRGVELKEVASGWRYQVRVDYADWVNRLWEEKPPRYSRAMLETLAIIAYRQPITRGEIEDIRGVAVSANIIRTLQEREWIKSVGHRDVPGKPELLATTKQFLDYFNLKKLADLPTLAEIRDLDDINPDLFSQLENTASIAAEAAEEDLLSQAVAPTDASTVAEDSADAETADADNSNTNTVTPTSGAAAESDAENSDDEDNVVQFSRQG